MRLLQPQVLWSDVCFAEGWGHNARSDTCWRRVRRLGCSCLVMPRPGLPIAGEQQHAQGSCAAMMAAAEAAATAETTDLWLIARWLLHFFSKPALEGGTAGYHSILVEGQTADDPLPTRCCPCRSCLQFRQQLTSAGPAPCALAASTA